MPLWIPKLRVRMHKHASGNQYQANGEVAVVVGAIITGGASVIVVAAVAMLVGPFLRATWGTSAGRR